MGREGRSGGLAQWNGGPGNRAQSQEAGMGPDSFSQNGWHHVAMGTLELLAIYGAILLLVVLVAGGLWLAHRRSAQRHAPLHRWPTASLASPPPRWGRPQWPADEGRLRASHADRDRAVTLLREATAEGYLTLDEFEERMGAVYSARHLRDLDALVDDIPGHPRPAALEPAAGGWRPVPARSHPAFPFAGILIAVAVMAIALHVWVVPAFPLVLLILLAVRLGRHHRSGFDGHWGSRV
ncbi:MAG TPA: DUF1707 domain-containing protein [Acidimicrobiales bacterium]